jgi:hypothetical protein
VERAGIEHLVDALAHREPAAGVLPLDALLAAHLLRDALALGELVEFFLPADLFLRRRHAAVHFFVLSPRESACPTCVL